MLISLVNIASYTTEFGTSLYSPLVKVQLEWFGIGWLAFFLTAAFDYNKLREWAWVLYVVSIIALVGLFFTDPIQNVRRWYKIPIITHSFQPSEYAKLSLVLALSWFLERMAPQSKSFATALGGLIIFAVPFLLILKQPDLGTALVFFPMTLVMFYFGGVHPFIVRTMTFFGVLVVALSCAFFSGIISHEEARPFFSKIIKEYQYERLNPNTHHQKAASLAIAVGGVNGVGFRESEYSRRGSLPYPHTDSAFPAFGEEFGLIGLCLMLVLFYALIYCSFQVVAVAKDPFGRLLSAGISVFIAVHICTNIGMMCGILPITGVPLVLVSYGGSSILCTMIALGILQSIYSRRFMF